MENNEFKFLGQKAESTTLIIGLLLILFGVFVSIISQSQSFTSFIPSILGLPLIVKCKFAYRRVKKRIRKKLGLKEKEENSDSDDDDDDEFGFGTPKRSRNKRRSGLTKITPMTETDIKAAKSKKKK